MRRLDWVFSEVAEPLIFHEALGAGSSQLCVQAEPSGRLNSENVPSQRENVPVEKYLSKHFVGLTQFPH